MENGYATARCRKKFKHHNRATQIFAVDSVKQIIIDIENIILTQDKVRSLLTKNCGMLRYIEECYYKSDCNEKFPNSIKSEIENSFVLIERNYLENQEILE